MKRLAALLALPLVLAGCVATGAGEPLAGASDAEAAALALPQTQRFAGGLQLAVGAEQNYLFPTTAVEPNGFVVAIPPDTAALVVELRWSNPVNDLDVIVYDSAGTRTYLDGGAPGAGDAPMKVVLRAGDFPTGDVLLRVVAKVSVAESYELAVTTFGTGEPGEDFTAFTG